MIGNPLSHQVTGQSILTPIVRTITALIVLSFTIGVIMFFFKLIMGGIKWISSGGDKQGLEEAKHQVSNALIGLVVLLSVYAIFSLITGFFGKTQLLNFSIVPLIQ
jgi:small-conductance mechanosensitive channel